MRFRNFASQILVLLVAGLPANAFGQRGVAPGMPPIYYESIGSGPTIVVLHGGPGVTHDYLRPEWDRLAEFGRVVFYDQRGCGRSAPEMAGITRWEDHVEDLHRLIRHLAPSEPVVLAGSSWGAHLALLYALQYPDRVRALVLSGAPTWRWWSEPRQRARSPEELSRMEDSARAMLERGEFPVSQPITPVTDPGLYGVDSAFAARFTEVCTASSVRRSLKRMPPLESLAELRTPTLLVRGDRTSPTLADGSDELAGALANASLVTIEGAGHDPWYNRPDEFFQNVLRFLGSVR